MDRGYNGKRPHPLHEGEGDMVERKWRIQGEYSGDSSNSREPRNLLLSHNVVFRILCPSQKIGYGNGGNIIKTLRQDSGVKVEVEDAIPGADERVIIISAQDRGSERGRSRDSRDRGRSRERDGGKEEDRKEREFSNIDGENLSAVQEALFEVHARIVAGAKTSVDASDHEEDPSQQVVLRMVVPINQIACLLGESTSAQIRFLPIDQRTGCATAIDVIVQVCGDAEVVKKALLFISSRLQDNPPPTDRWPSFASIVPAFVPGRDSSRSKDDLIYTGGLEHLERDPCFMRGGNLPLDRPDDKRRKVGRDSGKKELVFRLLCPTDKIGIVIGKSGRTILNLPKDTGARIIIDDVVPGSDERVITVSSFELPGDSFSPTLEAIIQLQRLMTVGMGGDKNGIVTTRLLLPTNQIGCLIGKGRSIIEDMRRTTKATIRLLSKDNLPSCASIDKDELLEILGEPTIARDALMEVIRKIRNNTTVDKPERGGDVIHEYELLRTMGSRSPPRGVSSMSELHSSTSVGRRNSPNVWGMGRKEKIEETSRDAILWVAETISQTMVEKMATTSETITKKMAETMVETMASAKTAAMARVLEDTYR